MRVFGAAMILCAFTAGGFLISVEMRRRCTFWERFITALEMLKAEIGYNGSDLKKAFAAASEVSGLKLFERAADRLSELGIDAAWAEAVREGGANTEDMKLLLLLSSRLGKTDVDGQLKHIEYISSLAEETRAKAENIYMEKGALFRRGGILVGIFVVLVLI
ncbi:MAG: stage III sporulation protein AB [bacterium]|nr:stage III sporulation protein AB [bacterium]